MAKMLSILTFALSLFAATVTCAAELAAAVTGLEGTSWQLVEFAGGDDTKIKPDDGSRYTLQFMNDGKVAARLDCNRGHGSWESKEPNQLRLGPMATTRAMCPPGSMHDRLVKDLPHVRSYVLKDGHLFLSLMADAGTYEFEPLAAK